MTDVRQRPKGYIDKEFLNMLQHDRKEFLKLPSKAKISLYRKHGARIGKDVILNTDSVISSPYIDLGEGVFIEENVVIECDQLRLGNLTHIGHGSTLIARRINFGENVFLSKNIEVGGGGARDFESEINIDSHCHIGQDVHLNCCRSILIGEESTIAIGTMIMTHAFANSVLEGYPAVFAPVKIGKHVQIGIRCVIFPGVTIGDGAVIGSNSSVISKIEAGEYAVGVPAKAVGKAARTLKLEDRHKIALDMIHEFLRQLSLNGVEINFLKKTPFEIAVTIKHSKGCGSLLFSENLEPWEFKKILSNKNKKKEIIGVCLHWGGDKKIRNVSTLIELLEKRIYGSEGFITDTLREFFRKRGIRLEPRTWTYRGGLL